MSKKEFFWGEVHGTGYPIDGLVIGFVRFDSEDVCHLINWQKDDDDAIVKTIYQTATDAELYFGTPESFREEWDAGALEFDISFGIPIESIKKVSGPPETDELIWSFSW